MGRMLMLEWVLVLLLAAVVLTNLAERLALPCIFLFPVVSTTRPPDPDPFAPVPITGPSSLIRIGPSQCSASVLSPRDFRRLCFSLAIRALVPAVPHKSLHPTHAPFTPVAVCPVIRLLADLSQKGFALLVLTTLSFLTTRLR